MGDLGFGHLEVGDTGKKRLMEHGSKGQEEDRGWKRHWGGAEVWTVNTEVSKSTHDPSTLPTVLSDSPSFSPWCVFYYICVYKPFLKTKLDCSVPLILKLALT